MKSFKLAAAFAVLAAPVLAEGHASTQGDPAAGEEAFNRQCVSCHVIVDDAGETIAGRNARTGPNLYGLPGRPVGSQAEFDQYGDSLLALGATGELWTEADFVGYVQDPTGWLREKLDDRRARGRMAFQVRSEAEAYDIFAYLVSVAPAQ
jgi:cytochrome c